MNKQIEQTIVHCLIGCRWYNLSLHAISGYIHSSLVVLVEVSD